MSEDDEWVQVDCIPSYFDADESHTSTLVAALVEVAAAYHNEGLVAVDSDDDAVVQLYSEACVLRPNGRFDYYWFVC